MPGTLILGATPIGNLQDVSRRLADAIASADTIFAEDTRHTQKLLNHLGIKRTMQSFHEHSPSTKLDDVADLLDQGQTLLYLSDAGTPGISDPGFELVRLAYAQHAQVDALPGPSAILVALVLSGLPTDRFAFLGFFPRKHAQRLKLLESLPLLGMTTIHFESPQRIIHTLDFLNETIPRTSIALCRELTKIHQEVLRGTPGQVRQSLTTTKGEMVLVIDAVTQLHARTDLSQTYQQLIASGATHNQAVKTLSQQFGLSKREIQKRLPPRPQKAPSES